MGKQKALNIPLCSISEFMEEMRNNNSKTTFPPVDITTSICAEFINENVYDFFLYELLPNSDGERKPQLDRNEQPSRKPDEFSEILNKRDRSPHKKETRDSDRIKKTRTQGHNRGYTKRKKRQDRFIRPLRLHSHRNSKFGKGRSLRLKRLSSSYNKDKSLILSQAGCKPTKVGE